MKAQVLHALHEPLRYEELAEPICSPGASLVSLRAAALNHRDLWITKGQYAGIRLPAILGSDGAGYLADRPVLINPNIGWGPNPKAQASTFTILGLQTPGTFAESVAIADDRIHDIPGHLSMQEAAALPLAGLTAYRATIKRAAIQAGEKVLVTGVGGGVALFALQFAIHAGAEVWVSSSSDDKINRAIQMGAAGGVNYKQEDWAEQLSAQAGKMDAIVDSSAGPNFNKLVSLAAPGGRIAIYGGTAGKVDQFNPQAVFWKQLSILGSTMGTDAEFSEMLDFVDTHKLRPVIDSVFQLKDVNEALQRMADARQFGKIVLEIPG